MNASSDAADQSSNHVGSAPSSATDAVLKPSHPVPEGSDRVRGVDFNHHGAHKITVEEMVAGMSSMGFQASAVGDAVRVIKDMVLEPCPPWPAV